MEHAEFPQIDRKTEKGMNELRRARPFGLGRGRADILRVQEIKDRLYSPGHDFIFGDATLFSTHKQGQMCGSVTRQ